jgi:RNA polymerase sigma-70 factor, ECF subfamily
VGFTDWSDGELMAAVVLRDEEAFAEVIRRHSASVKSASSMILGRDGRCDDVVREVFSALWISPEEFDPSRGSLLEFLRIKARTRSIELVHSGEAARWSDDDAVG